MTLTPYSDTRFIDVSQIAAILIEPGNTTDKRLLMFGGHRERLPNHVAEELIELAGKSLVEVEPFSAFINPDFIIFAGTYFDNSVNLYKVSAKVADGTSFTAHFSNQEDAQSLLHLLGVEGGDAAPKLPYDSPEQDGPTPEDNSKKKKKDKEVA